MDEFELAVVGPDGRPLPEVEHAGKAYVVAAPGQSFQLRCSWHGRHCLHQGEGYQVGGKGTADRQPAAPTALTTTGAHWFELVQNTPAVLGQGGWPACRRQQTALQPKHQHGHHGLRDICRCKNCRGMGRGHAGLNALGPGCCWHGALSHPGLRSEPRCCDLAAAIMQTCVGCPPEHSCLPSQRRMPAGQSTTWTWRRAASQRRCTCPASPAALLPASTRALAARPRLRKCQRARYVLVTMPFLVAQRDAGLACTDHCPIPAAVRFSG